MSGQIKMSLAELMDRDKTNGQGSGEIQTTLGNLSKTQEILRSEWEGEAFRRFDDQFQQLSAKTVEFSQLLESIELQLINTAKAMEEQDQALSQNFGLF